MWSIRTWNPLITFGLMVTRSTSKPRQNVAIYRQQVIGPNRAIMRWLPHRGGALDYADWCAAHPHEPFPVLVAIRADPATMLAAVAPVPDSLSEYEFAGLLRGQRTRVWRSELTGIDATNKWPSETSRAWSRPIVPDAAVARRADALWATLARSDQAD